MLNRVAATLTRSSVQLPARPQARELGSCCPLKGGGGTSQGPGCEMALSDAKGRADLVNTRTKRALFLGNAEYLRILQMQICVYRCET